MPVVARQEKLGSGDTLGDYTLDTAVQWLGQSE